MGKKSPAKVLKDKGLIPKTWNLRKLSRGQKSWVTKQARTFAAVVRKPKEFTTVSAKTSKHREQAKSSGLRITNNRAVIHLPHGGRARRVGDRIVTVSEDGQQREYFYADASTFLDVLDAARSIKLKRNQIWGIAGDGFELNKFFDSIDELQKYLTNIRWDKKAWGKYIALVLITEDGWFDYGDRDE